MFTHSAEELHTALSGPSSEQKYQILIDLKAHIKREFVSLNDVPSYFDILKTASRSSDLKLSLLAFSTVCHLVKRVSMQDSNYLKPCAKSILPILLNKLIDPKPQIQTQAKHTLETYWLANPAIVETFLKDSGLIHSNYKIRAETILFISNLVDLNSNFKFNSFLPNLINLFRDDHQLIIKNLNSLLLKYYTKHKFKLNDLTNELTVQKIELKSFHNLLKELDPRLLAQFRSNELKEKSPPSTSGSSSSNNSGNSLPSELSEILAKIPTTKLDVNLKPVVLTTAQDLTRETEALLKPFIGKETEFNWNQREKNIIRLRSLILGNHMKFPEILINSIKLLNDGINKSINSLRTTLSNNGCQLIKEAAVYLNKLLDPIQDILFHSLALLTSATKKISSLNSFGSICQLIANTSFNQRIFTQCFNLFNDKNIQPRLYSSTFLQILILKHNMKFDNNNQEIITKWISKGLIDQNISVRESMRLTFWIFHRYFKDSAEIIYNKQDLNIKKILEKVRPKGEEEYESKGSIVSKRIEVKKKPSVRELIKQNLRKSESLETLRENKENFNHRKSESLDSKTEDVRSNRIGMPQRVASHNNSLLQPKRSASYSLETSSNDELSLIKGLLNSSSTKEKIEGIELLKKTIQSSGTPIEMNELSIILNKLIIIDPYLFKPLLHLTKFIKNTEIEILLKLYSINKIEIDQVFKKLLEIFGNLKLINGNLALIKSLDSINFENAEQTMFNIKFKNLFLNYSIDFLLALLIEDGELDQSVYGDICSNIFPLAINNYNNFNQLITQLFTQNKEYFNNSLSSINSSYIKSKINAIIIEFQSDKEINEEFMDQPLTEMTMINPLNKKPTDPTVNFRNVSNDMTMIIPNFKRIEINNEADKIDMSDIFKQPPVPPLPVPGPTLAPTTQDDSFTFENKFEENSPFIENKSSINEMIKSSDPIFKTVKKEIKIFQDEEPLPIPKNVFELELQVSEDAVSFNELFLFKVMNSLKSNDVLLKELNYLINLVHSVDDNSEFKEWLELNNGDELIINNVLNYFSNETIKKEIGFKMLCVVKEILIKKHVFKVEASVEVKIFNILITILKNLNREDEIFLIIKEIFVEFELASFDYELILNEFDENDMLLKFLNFSINQMIRFLNFEQFARIDPVLFKYLNKNIEIKRLVILNYSTFKNQLGLKLDDEVFSKFSKNEIKLIEIYAS